jgi:hypothetical protein
MSLKRRPSQVPAPGAASGCAEAKMEVFLCLFGALSGCERMAE